MKPILILFFETDFSEVLLEILLQIKIFLAFKAILYVLGEGFATKIFIVFWFVLLYLTSRFDSKFVYNSILDGNLFWRNFRTIFLGSYKFRDKIFLFDFWKNHLCNELFLIQNLQRTLFLINAYLICNRRHLMKYSIKY